MVLLRQLENLALGLKQGRVCSVLCRAVQWRGTGGILAALPGHRLLWGRWECSQSLQIPRPSEQFAVAVQAGWQLALTGSRPTNKNRDGRCFRADCALPHGNKCGAEELSSAARRGLRDAAQ